MSSPDLPDARRAREGREEVVARCKSPVRYAVVVLFLSPPLVCSPDTENSLFVDNCLLTSTWVALVVRAGGSSPSPFFAAAVSFLVAISTPFFCSATYLLPSYTAGCCGDSSYISTSFHPSGCTLSGGLGPQGLRDSMLYKLTYELFQESGASC